MKTKSRLYMCILVLCTWIKLLCRPRYIILKKLMFRGHILVEGVLCQEKTGLITLVLNLTAWREKAWELASLKCQSGLKASHSGQRASNSDQRVSQSNQKVFGRCEMLSGRFEACRIPGFFPSCLAD